MADIVFNGNGPKPERCRVWNVQREFTANSPPLPCQLHVMLEGDMNDGAKVYKKLTINPGLCRDYGCDIGTFETLFASCDESEDQGDFNATVQVFLAEHAPLDKLEDMFLC